MSTRVEVKRLDPTGVWFSPGVSREAEEVSKEHEKEYKPDRQTPASFAWRDLLVEQIADILQTCSDQGWDGYEAVPASRDSAHSAVELIRGLPKGIQTPAVVPEPDGDIALEWRTEDSRIFSLSVGCRKLVYAGRFGGSVSRYGQEEFFGAIPRKILAILAEYFPAS